MLAVRKPYVLGSGKPSKYRPTSLDGHRVLANGSIVARTVSISVPDTKKPGKKVVVPVDESFDAEMIKMYQDAVKKQAKGKKTSKKA